MEDKENIMRKRFRKVLDDRNQNDKTRKNEISKDRLKTIIKKHITTVMIGAVAKMENFFGDLWGHGLEEENCSDDQLDKYEVWEQCRDEILTHGNKILNIVMSELNNFEVIYKGHSYVFYNKGRENGNEK